jgi:hypothetical protein
MPLYRALRDGHDPRAMVPEMVLDLILTIPDIVNFSPATQR